MSGLYKVYAEDLEGKRRFLSKAVANNNGNGLFSLYADECGDEEEVVIVRIDADKSKMRNEIKIYMSGKPNYDVRTALHVCKIGRDYVHVLSLYEGSKVEKVTIEDFYREYVF